MEQQRDERLWKIAQKRANFRKSIYSYVIVILFLWGVWWFTTGYRGHFDGIPWPVWVMLGWGLGLAKQYYEAYQSDKSDLADREYEKLKSKEKF